ncbi:MAG: CvpA family protein [Treponema sp.]|jgi:membrane protein required for colicin V production|nr:CvpA family protein [Treponema sp.]
MAGIDTVFLIIIAISALRCAVRGFISELLSMAALIFGLLSAIFFYRMGAAFIREQAMPEATILPEVIAFIAIFLIVYVIIKIIEAMLKDITEGIHLGGLDRFLGGIFGVVEGLVLVCLLLFLISIQPLFDPDPVLANSFFAKTFMPVIFGGRNEFTKALESLTMAGTVSNV